MITLSIDDPEQSGENTKIHTDKKEGYELVRDGHIKYTDIIFEWCKVLNPWHANAVKSVINSNSILHPDHPLSDGKGGVILYLGTDVNGHKRLLFSLHQIDYLRYWIHEMRLTDPKRVMELARDRDTPLETEGTEEHKDEMSVDDVEAVEWIPLPNTILRGDSFVQMETHRFMDIKDIKRVCKELRKSDQGLTDMDKTREAARIDNLTPGPGLRRGPMRQRDSRPSRKSVDLGGQDGIGWGGFPLETSLGSPEKNEDGEPNGRNDTKTDKLISETDVVAPSQDLAAYHHHSEQALVLASQGGLAGVFKLHDSEPNKEERPGLEHVFDATRRKIGRSLFLALTVSLGDGHFQAEGDDVVSEVGWAGIWFQEKLGAPGDGSEVGGTNEEDNCRYEEVRDLGHWIVQDHLLARDNTPDQKPIYHFGTSIPIARKDLQKSIQMKVDDLRARAGEGPVYVICHSHEMLKGFTGLLNVDEWLTDFLPGGWEYPTYAAEEGVASPSIIQNSSLFSAITSTASEHIPKSTIDDVGKFLFRNDDQKEMIDIKNAGNAAVYVLESFIQMATTPLEDLQAEWQDYYVPKPDSAGHSADFDSLSADTESTQVTDSSTAAKTAETDTLELDEAGRDDNIKRLAGIMDRFHSAQVDDDDEDESEGDDIKGVYIDGEDGEAVEIW